MCFLVYGSLLFTSTEVRGIVGSCLVCGMYYSPMISVKTSVYILLTFALVLSGLGEGEQL